MASDDPQAFFGAGRSDKDRYTNPFYNIPLQYMPQSIEGMLLWTEHLLFRNGFFKQAINRVANYFITNIVIECDDEAAKGKYQEALEVLHWRQALGVAGQNLLTFGNEFTTVNQGFTRHLTCPKCRKTTNIDKIKFTFDKGIYMSSCISKSCNYSGKFKCDDMPSRAVEDIHLVHWPAKEIKIRHEDTTGQSEFFWDIPQTYIKKVTSKNDKFFPRKTPAVIYECIQKKAMMAFNPKNFLHLKLDNPTTIRTDGKAIPPAMFMFEDFFMLQTLKRYNEVICFEDISPFRVVSMSSDPNPAVNPFLHQNGGVWAAAVDDMITEHRRDPGAYHKFPFPLNYQQLGGDASKLVPTELIEKAKHDILNALNIPVEMFEMTFQQQAAGPMLRMFENAWSTVPINYNRLLSHIGKVVGSILGLPEAKISLIPITFSDDIERKQVIGQLVSANSIARSELLKLYNFDFEDQLRKKREEERIAKDIDEEEKERDAVANIENQNIMSVLQGNQPAQAPGQGGIAQQAGAGGGTPQDALERAQQLAQQLFPLDGAQRRTELQQIKAQDQDLWASVKAQLEQMTSQAGSQGVQGAKQQAAGPTQ